MNETKDQRDDMQANDEASGAEAHTDVVEPAENREASPAPDAQVAMQEEIESLKEELSQTRDQLLRKAAEFQNYRRRTEEEKRVLVQIGRSAVIEQLLDVVDDFARAVEAARAEGATVESIGAGVEMVYEKLMGELKKVGVEPIECVGRAFDENEHEALMRQPAPDGTEPGTVLQEIQRGYKMEDRVLRHSRVVVASEPE